MANHLKFTKFYFRSSSKCSNIQIKSNSSNSHTKQIWVETCSQTCMFKKISTLIFYRRSNPRWWTPTTRSSLCRTCQIWTASLTLFQMAWCQITSTSLSEIYFPRSVTIRLSSHWSRDSNVIFIAVTLKCYKLNSHLIINLFEIKITRLKL